MPVDLSTTSHILLVINMPLALFCRAGRDISRVVVGFLVQLLRSRIAVAASLVRHLMARRRPTAAPVGGATAIADTKAAKPPPVAAGGDAAAPTPPSSNTLALRMPVSTLADQQGSQLFTGYRALGHVCDGVPVALQFHNTHSYVLTSVGHSFHLYGVRRKHEPTRSHTHVLAFDVADIARSLARSFVHGVCVRSARNSTCCS